MGQRFGGEGGGGVRGGYSRSGGGGRGSSARRNSTTLAPWLAAPLRLCWEKLQDPSGLDPQSPQSPTRFRSFEKGWRTEGVGVRRSFLCHRFRPLFCTSFPIPHYEKGDTLPVTSGGLFGCSSGLASCQPPPANFWKILTLPALQKNFVNIFFGFAWEFCIEKWRGFLVNFFCSPSPTKRSTKSARKIREKFGAKFGAKFGTKIRKIRETFVLQLSDLKDSREFWPYIGFGKRGLLEKGSFRKSPFSGDSREFRDYRDFREPHPVLIIGVQKVQKGVKREMHAKMTLFDHFDFSFSLRTVTQRSERSYF